MLSLHAEELPGWADHFRRHPPGAEGVEVVLSQIGDLLAKAAGVRDSRPDMFAWWRFPGPDRPGAGTPPGARVMDPAEDMLLGLREGAG